MWQDRADGPPDNELRIQLQNRRRVTEIRQRAIESRLGVLEAGVIAPGAAIGLALLAAFSRLLSSIRFGVQPLDPLTFGAVALALVVTAAVATAAPAWRAIRIDPAVALRAE